MGNNFFCIRFQGSRLSGSVEIFVKNRRSGIGNYTNILMELDSQLEVGMGGK